MSRPGDQVRSDLERAFAQSCMHNVVGVAVKELVCRSVQWLTGTVPCEGALELLRPAEGRVQREQEGPLPVQATPQCAMLAAFAPRAVRPRATAAPGTFGCVGALPDTQRKADLGRFGRRVDTDDRHRTAPSCPLPPRPDLSPPAGGAAAASALEHLAQHGVQDAAVAPVVDLDQRVEPGRDREAAARAVGALELDDHVLARLDLARQAADGQLLLAGQAQRLGVLPVPELPAAARPCPPGWSGGCARSSRRSPPARPAAACPWRPSRASCPSRTPCRPGSRAGSACRLGSARRRRRCVKLLARRAGARCTPPSTPGTMQVPEPDVGEGAAHHHLVVAAPGAVAVEVLPARRPCSIEVAPGRAGLG